MTTETLHAYPTPGVALAAQAAERGEREALVFPHQDRRFTYAEWHAQSSALARGLVTLGVQPGDHVGLLAEARIEWPVVQLAIAMAGAVMVPLNTHYRRDDLAYALANSEVSRLFLSDGFRSSPFLDMTRAARGDAPRLETLISLDGPHENCLDCAALIEQGGTESAPLPDVSPDAVASLQFTSGTTGFPKGALLTHGGMMANAWGISGRLRVTEDDRWTSIIPLFHCAGCIMCILGTLQRGACYVGVPAFDPVGMFEVMEGERCTMLSGVPTSHVAMLNHPDRSKYDLSRLRAGTCGGADTDPALLRDCADAFPIQGVVQVYGQTEASTLISLADCTADERFETCGPPLPGAEVRITDLQTGADMPAGEIGQIETRGPMVMHGYFNNPQATEETIAPDGWMKTGDLGYLTPEGNVVVAGGRLRDMIIRGGENIYPVEIENHLRAHPAVTEIAVFGVADDYYGEIVAAAVTPNGPVTAAELGAFCDGRIARFKIPARYFRVDTFPLTASGKIRKTELRDMAAAGEMRELG